MNWKMRKSWRRMKEKIKKEGDVVDGGDGGQVRIDRRGVSLPIRGG